jgi:transposase
MIREFDLNPPRFHIDLTTVTFHDDYDGAMGVERGGQLASAITHGHNKDCRSDLKQLLFILTISADGAMPIVYRSADGNTADDTTHVETWDSLLSLVETSGFTNVADFKLCSDEHMRRIAKSRGRFFTIVPRTRREDTCFRDFAQSHAPAWQEASRRAGPRMGAPTRSGVPSSPRSPPKRVTA